MATHIVEQGECLSSLAARVGLQAQDLHNDPANADLRKLRPYPNILSPGDIVEIPDPAQKDESAPTDKTHRFVIHGPKVKLRIAMLDYLGNPYEGKRYIVTMGKREVKGRTASGGLIECDIPADAQHGHLRVWLDDADPEPHIDRDLLIGHLDPIDLVSGVQARLHNLGYCCPVTGELDNATLVALQLFRLHNGLSAGTTPASSSGSNDGSDSLVANPGSADDADLTPADSDPGFMALNSDLLDDAVRSKLQSLYEAR